MKIVPVFLRYDYGVKSKGPSLEYTGFYQQALSRMPDKVYPFWYDEYLTDKKELQKRVIKFIDEVAPDAVFFVLMKDEFSPETLKYLKSKYITINWFCDDQWRFENFTKYYAPHFTYCVTTDKFAISKYKNIGYTNVILSQWASFGFDKNPDFDKIEYKYDVSFVGGRSTYREWLIKQLGKRNVYVDCFGHGWPGGRVSFEKISDVFRTSKINLNISNSVSPDIRYVFSNYKSLKEFIKLQKRVEQIKARNFEMPAFGGFQLTNYVLCLEDYFKIGKEIAVYTTLDELLLQIQYYLENEEERKQIMLNGHKRVMDIGPTYVDRFREIFNSIRK